MFTLSNLCHSSLAFIPISNLTTASFYLFGRLYMRLAGSILLLQISYLLTCSLGFSSQLYAKCVVLQTVPCIPFGLRHAKVMGTGKHVCNPR